MQLFMAEGAIKFITLLVYSGGLSDNVSRVRVGGGHRYLVPLSNCHLPFNRSVPFVDFITLPADVVIS